ncbi:MAG: hypothetical protein IJI40_09555 [Firmicutes bacterium]|nr:hypothetical protein [Bacillota bacterium]MBQ6606954.1 hypothetical protein [Bacillota bacterium]
MANISAAWMAFTFYGREAAPPVFCRERRLFGGVVRYAFHPCDEGLFV